MIDFPHDPYVWIDPMDAVFVTSCREALKIERAAWEKVHAERTELLKRCFSFSDAQLLNAISEACFITQDSGDALLIDVGRLRGLLEELARSNASAT